MGTGRLTAREEADSGGLRLSKARQVCRAVQSMFHCQERARANLHPEGQLGCLQLCCRCCLCISGSRQLDRGLLSWSSRGRRGRGSLCQLGSALASAVALLARAALAGRGLRSLLESLWRRGGGSWRRLRCQWRCGRLDWRCRAGGLASAAAARSRGVRGSRARALAATRLRRRHISADTAEVSGAAARQLRLCVSRRSLNLALRAPGRLCSRWLSGKASRLCLQGRDLGRIELVQICSTFHMICANNDTAYCCALHACLHVQVAQYPATTIWRKAWRTTCCQCSH